MSDTTVLPESILTDAAAPAALVIRDVNLDTNGSIRVRRINSAGIIEWVRILDDNNTIRLRPTDRIVLEGNVLCVVYLEVGGSRQEAVAQIECIRAQPEAPVWAEDEDPEPSGVDSRFIALQHPPVIDVHDLVDEGVAIREVFTPGAMFQIQA